MNQKPQEFFVAGGALRSNAPSYVNRPADSRLQELITKGELCYVLTTRQMGKSSLMVRTAALLEEHGIHTAIIDLTSIGTATIDEWYLSLLDDLQSQLPIFTDAEEWWEENSSLSQVKRFTKFIQEVLPEEIDGKVAIFIDEIDCVLNLDFTDDFFAAIRAIYNRDAQFSTSQRIAFVLLGVAAPNDLIKDQTKTPFNIGVGIELEELSIDEAQVLLEGLPGQSLAILQRIFYWTNGHPYLTQKIGLTINQEDYREWADVEVDTLIEELFLTDEASSRENNLQFVHKRVLSSPNKIGLLALYDKIYKGKKIESNEQSIYQNELKLYGLIRADRQGNLVIRNRIYHRVFNQEWINENTPVNWWRRAAVGAVIIAIFAVILVIYSIQQTPEPDDVLAQSYIANFEETTNPTLRLDNLANIFALNDYNDEAVKMFHSLSTDEQIALFESATPDLAPQVRRVIQGTYVTLYADDLLQTQDTTRLLEAMATALVKSTDAESRALRDEIDIWLEGRSYASQEEYVPAKIAYGLAIRLNDNNPATYLERALTSQRIADYEEAISDLTAVWERGAAWEEIVLEIVNSDTQLQDALWVQDELPPFSPFVPTATPSVTLVATQLPTETPKPSLTLTLIPQETPSPSLTATSTPTSTPSSTPSPTNTPVDTKTPVPLRITGLPSGELKNPFVFTWSGPASTRYRVVLRQLTEGYTHTSNWLSKFEWTFDIPGEQFGAWEWYVESETGVNSSRSEFFFNPHTGSGNSGSESGGYPGPKPTSVPKPTSPYTGP